MTKIENNKCKTLMYEAIKKAESAEMEYTEAEKHLADANELEWETEQRKADQHIGYAQGIYQVLSVIGFKHEDMKKLASLI